jgi:hypothetical protein
MVIVSALPAVLYVAQTLPVVEACVASCVISTA